MRWVEVGLSGAARAALPPAWGRENAAKATKKPQSRTDDRIPIAAYIPDFFKSSDKVLKWRDFLVYK
ncbi:hypothetical protein [Reyranella sp.]|uniref:hypothetical protein n=1 Tax=Reyranella sp. TaxID=1929291 RepID=UPI003C7C04E3